MSWDIFIQNLPGGIVTAAEIPDDFEPAPLGPKATILAKLQNLHPAFTPDASGFGPIEIEGGSIEIALGDTDPTMCVALLVHGGAETITFVIEIVRALGGLALDPASPTGLFDERLARESFDSSATYHDLTAARPAPPHQPWWHRMLRGKAPKGGEGR